MQIGSHVRKKRRALGLSQSDLALELGVSHQHISRIELGDATPSLKMLLMLGDRLGVSVDYLLTGREQAPLDAAGAIRSEPLLGKTAKRHLVGLLEELRAGGSANAS